MYLCFKGSCRLLLLPVNHNVCMLSWYKNYFDRVSHGYLWRVLKLTSSYFIIPGISIKIFLYKGIMQGLIFSLFQVSFDKGIKSVLIVLIFKWMNSRLGCLDPKLAVMEVGRLQLTLLTLMTYPFWLLRPDASTSYCSFWSFCERKPN